MLAYMSGSATTEKIDNSYSLSSAASMLVAKCSSNDESDQMKNIMSLHIDDEISAC